MSYYHYDKVLIDHTTIVLSRPWMTKDQEKTTNDEFDSSLETQTSRLYLYKSTNVVSAYYPSSAMKANDKQRTANNKGTIPRYKI